jgi:hypothetical protein
LARAFVPAVEGILNNVALMQGARLWDTQHIKKEVLDGLFCLKARLFPPLQSLSKGLFLIDGEF